MPPKQPGLSEHDLFRMQLENMIDTGHALVKLARRIDWAGLDAEWGKLYEETGRPGLPTRLMAGLHLIKHMEGLSDEQVCARWIENPYWQYFCGESVFQHSLVFDRSSMTRWRRRIGPEKLERLLAETLRVAMTSGALSRNG
jgi:IS5 family transposase